MCPPFISLEIGKNSSHPPTSWGNLTAPINSANEAGYNNHSCLCLIVNVTKVNVFAKGKQQRHAP